MFRLRATWPMTLLALGAIVLFIELGLWQWHRGEARDAQLAQFTAAAAHAPVPLGSHGTSGVPRWTRVEVTGEYDGARQFLLDNVPHDGRPGYHVLTPLTLADGRMLIVDRGWLPFSGYRDRLPDVSLAAHGAQQLTGRVGDLPLAGLAAGRVPPPTSGDWPRLTSFPSVADLAAALGAKLEPQVLMLDASLAAGAGGTAGGTTLVREWTVPGMAAARHYAYAVQWWAMALAVLVVFVVVNREKKAS